ncbi:response regulator [Bacillus tuaregi]|uniref:response regulator n=1 Tax=Bacillus tuaregi TaxID=1816695 RepID=UPI0008F814CB|nr:response regulator [Bacillus tuaregi]
MKIKTKLLLVLCTLPALLFILIGIGWVQQADLNSTSRALQTNYQLSSVAGQIHTDVKDVGIRLRNLVIFTDETALQKELLTIESIRDNIKQNISFLESNTMTEEQRELIVSLKQTNQEFNLYQDEVLAAISQGKKEDALVLIDESSVSIHEDFFTVISTITSTLHTNVEASMSTMLKDFQHEILIGGVVLAIGILLIIVLLYRNIQSITVRMNSMSEIMSDVANGKAELSTKVEIRSNDEMDEMAISFNQMTESLEIQKTKEQELTWIKSNMADITTSLNGSQDVKDLGNILLSKVVPLLESCHAVLYVKEAEEEAKQEPVYRLVSSYAFKERKQVSNTIRLGEGLAGQVVLEKTPIILTDVPADYVRISSGLGHATPLQLYVLPILFEGDVKAVLEMASFKSYSETQQSFLEELINGVGIILDSVMGRIQLAQSLEKSQQLMEEIQAQSEELQSQQEELRATNEELEEQTQALRQSEEKLQLQQEELEQTNTDLEEKAKSLEEQNTRFERTNREVEKARAELEMKAQELALSSKYKTEFLANMSHELRTPLNSLLILSKLLADNSEGNLTAKQVEFSKTIYSSGNDLLILINDILDLAKIESGKTQLQLSDVKLTDIVSFVESSFRPIANDKNLNFSIFIQEGLPDSIYSDGVRIQQVLKNLLSNAFKFTMEGEIKLDIMADRSTGKQNKLIFSVSDTGIGISKDKQDLIFEAFQQADGTTSRKYGGTGLGLSISRELAALLGGKIAVESEEGKGSSFMLYMGDYDGNEAEAQAQIVRQEVAAAVIEENDSVDTGVGSGTVDTVVDLIEREDNQIKRLLIVDDDMNQRSSLMELIGEMNFIIKAVSSGSEAMEELKVNGFDCVILDLGLGDTSGFELLEKIKENDQSNKVKVIIYTGRDVTSKEEIQLSKYAYSIIIKNELSPQRLKEELALFLQESDQHNISQEVAVSKAISIPSGLQGKKILLVDDDVRNVFALSSILELNGMHVSFAENGIEGLEMIERIPEIDLVLMDIMMPEMDGYEAIGRIRQIQRFQELPIIALTAKAMKNDREKCLEAGASDYIVKPIDPEKLISLIKVWLY